MIDDDFLVKEQHRLEFIGLLITSSNVFSLNNLCQTPKQNCPGTGERSSL